MQQLHRAKLADVPGGQDQPPRVGVRPDLLDEVRWEVEWMLRMQVPAGQPHAGLAHHKIHDQGWNVHLGPNRELTLTLPDGTVHNTGPPTRKAA